MSRHMHQNMLVLVCDGRKALFMRAKASAGQLILEVERELHADTPAHSAEMGTDRPGRVKQMMGPRSAIQGADLHAAEETAFLRGVVEQFESYSEDAPEVTLVAPPRALAILRQMAGKRLLAKTRREIDKDLTKHPVDEIQRIISAED